MFPVGAGFVRLMPQRLWPFVAEWGNMVAVAERRRSGRRPGGSVVLLAGLAAAGLLVGGSCSVNSPGPAPSSSGPGSSSSSTTAATSSTTSVVVPPCPTSDDLIITGSVANTAITESSGVAASLVDPDLHWIHNDSGDMARIFAMSGTGADLGTFEVTGASAVDWEDIAIGPGPPGADGYIYVGDIGGNAGRADLVIYRAPEPAVDRSGPPVQGALGGVVALPVRYPNGERHNAEALMVDPLNGDLYIVTKAADGDSRIFRYAAASHTPGVTAVLEQVGSRRFSAPGTVLVTGGDIAGDGSEIALRTYDRLYLWARSPGQSVAEAISGEPCVVTVTGERQGEAVGYELGGNGLLLTSEGVSQPLRWLGRP